MLQCPNDTNGLLPCPMTISMGSQGFGYILVGGKRNEWLWNRQIVVIGFVVFVLTFFVIDCLSIRIHLIGDSIVKSNFRCDNCCCCRFRKTKNQYNKVLGRVVNFCIRRLHSFSKFQIDSKLFRVFISRNSISKRTLCDDVPNELVRVSADSLDKTYWSSDLLKLHLRTCILHLAWPEATYYFRRPCRKLGAAPNGFSPIAVSAPPSIPGRCGEPSRLSLS